MAIAGIACGVFAGCASYTQSKIDLTAQAQAGVDRLREGVATMTAEQDQAIGRLRSQLDLAFDEDVSTRDATSLTPEWIIAHRQAYAAAIDAFAERRRGQTGLSHGMIGTLDAIDLVLAQLQQMHQAELRLTLPEVKR